MARGDHIHVLRKLGYTHHGIDCGDGTVIHFSGEPGSSKAGASITRCTMEDFLSGGALRKREYGKRNDPDVTVGRAESSLSDTGYHLVVNNCEHFATWCCTGRRASRQVRGVGSLTAQGAVAATSVTATGGVIAAAGAVQGLSGAGVMSGLASAGGVVGGGAAIGPAVIGAAPALVTVGIAQIALRDDDSLPASERAARRDGRYASVAGAGAATAGGVAAISAMGTTAGLSAAGITSGLAAIGGLAGGGMVAGATIVAAAPVVATAGAATAIFLSRGGPGAGGHRDPRHAKNLKLPPLHARHPGPITAPHRPRRHLDQPTRINRQLCDTCLTSLNKFRLRLRCPHPRRTVVRTTLWATSKPVGHGRDRTTSDNVALVRGCLSRVFVDANASRTERAPLCTPAAWHGARRSGAFAQWVTFRSSASTPTTRSGPAARRCDPGLLGPLGSEPPAVVVIDEVGVVDQGLLDRLQRAPGRRVAQIKVESRRDGCAQPSSELLVVGCIGGLDDQRARRNSRRLV